MSTFATFREAVAKNFKRISKGNLYVVDMGRDELFDVYLSAFPEGTDPIFRERTEHDCNCCKNFIRNVGGVVTIKNGELVSIWDLVVADETYQVVADAMAEYVQTKSIKDVFLHNETKVGREITREYGDDGAVIKWDHFEVTLPSKVLVRGGQSMATKRGEIRTHYEILKRSVTEITTDAIDTVSDLIAHNSLYRGNEHKNTVSNLAKTKRAYDKASNKEAFLWETAVELGHGCRFRNTVIGTLLVDLSDNVELEKAVKSFEQKVAPANYKRPKALVTQAMIDRAQDKVEELGLEPSLHRRYAVESDLTINNVLFADRSTKANMKNGVFGDIKPTKGKTKKTLDKVQEMSATEFIDNVLPKAETVEVFLENKHSSNFVSLIAPVYDDAPDLTKWNNNFTWSYNGEVTDSIKERVKSAGGNVDGDVRVSLSWFNYDDLDLHVVAPGGEIYFGNKRGRCGGQLDVDMNAGGRNSREPVENIFWRTRDSMDVGRYKVVVHQFSKRETSDVGFEIQVQVGDMTMDYSHPKDVASNQNVKVFEFEVDAQKNIKILGTDLDENTRNKEVWGVNTQDFVKAKMVMKSPNFWDGQAVGNEHLFFILEDCVNPEKARGFYNEFLKDDLHEHRKVLELLGSKLKTEQSDTQLSGIGFSSTQFNEVLVRVSGSFNRTIKVKF